MDTDNNTNFGDSIKIIPPKPANLVALEALELLVRLGLNRSGLANLVDDPQVVLLLKRGFVEIKAPDWMNTFGSICLTDDGTKFLEGIHAIFE